MKILIFIFLLIPSVKLFGQSNIQISKEIEMIINNFQAEVNDAKVLLIKHSEEKNADVFLVTFVVYFETISNPYPSFVFEYKNSYVCLYTGVEKFITQPTEFKDKAIKKLSTYLEREEIINSPINKDNKGEEYEIEIGSTFEPYFKEYVFKNKRLISSKEILPTAIDSLTIKKLFDFN